MSTDYRSIPAILFTQLFDGRLEKYGVRVKVDPTGRRCLVGNDGFLEVYEKSDGTSSFSRRAYTPVPCVVLDAITEEFDTEMVDEHDHRYWGFATAQEEAEYLTRKANEEEDKFYMDIVRYLRSEANGLKDGTIGMLKAKIAATLVAGDESLTAPDNRKKLLVAIEEIYEFEHGAKQPTWSQVN